MLDSWYKMYLDAPETMYSSNTSIHDFLELEYGQFLAAIQFLYPESLFSTDHGVKGEEYDNVIFTIGRGWSQYQFDVYAPMITSITNIPNEKEAAYERNRNLFYVCCSRAKKRLFLFITIPINDIFRKFLTQIFTEDNIYTYSEFIASYEG